MLSQGTRATWTSNSFFNNKAMDVLVSWNVVSTVWTGFELGKIAVSNQIQYVIPNKTNKIKKKRGVVHICHAQKPDFETKVKLNFVPKYFD